MILSVQLQSKSGRLTLVPPQESDDADVAALRSHAETRRFLRYFPQQCSISDARARRVAREPDPTLVDFHIHASDPPTGATSAFVGTTGIFRIDNEYGRTCEVGILISPAYFRGGLATDALYTVLVYVFEERKMHRAEFQTGADNSAMRGWLEKAGATLEGTKREVWSDPSTGGYTDVCMYSILGAEWEATVRGRLEARMNRNVV
ncbi:acyl-CoA N-acyltransferase [Mycena epipterygia]|nr:acyl-CoA N-acyltransferase [Mycena epipterygia]